MSARGMKKWAPFSSLIEQSTCLEEMRYQKNKIEKPLISIEKAREINEILTNYHGQELLITYYFDGYLFKVNAIILSINKTKKEIRTDKGTIPLNAIIDIFDENFSNNFDNYIS